MPGFERYRQVRVRRLLRPADEYDGWQTNLGPPQVGDVGTIVDILNAAGLPERYVVENSGPDGVTVWLADFAAEELEAIDS